MLERVFFSALDHLLAQNTWALQRLRPFAGRTGLFTLGESSWSFQISEQGTFVPGPSSSHDVTISLPTEAIAALISDPASLMTNVQLSGYVEFAEVLGNVFRNLRWDLAYDLSAVVGELAAQRLVSGGRLVGQYVKRSADSTARTVAEYLSFETSVLVPTQEHLTLISELEEQRDTVDRLEARIRILERKNST